MNFTKNNKVLFTIQIHLGNFRLSTNKRLVIHVPNGSWNSQLSINTIRISPIEHNTTQILNSLSFSWIFRRVLSNNLMDIADSCYERLRISAPPNVEFFLRFSINRTQGRRPRVEIFNICLLQKFNVSDEKRFSHCRLNIRWVARMHSNVVIKMRISIWRSIATRMTVKNSIIKSWLGILKANKKNANNYHSLVRHSTRWIIVYSLECWNNHWNHHWRQSDLP